NIIAALPEGKRPRLDITLGGEGGSSGFSAVAADAAKRTLAAQNIQALFSQTGATAVDLDWENPAGNTEIKTNFPALLTRIKEVGGADRRVLATAEPTILVGNSIFTDANHIDGVSLMTYNLSWWGNDPDNPAGAEHSLPQYVSAAVD